MTVDMENLMGFGSQVMLQQCIYVISMLDNFIFAVGKIFYDCGQICYATLIILSNEKRK